MTNARNYTEAEKEQFIEGFRSIIYYYVPGYHFNDDMRSDAPCCQPWTWHGYEQEYRLAATPYKAGRRFAVKYHDFIYYFFPGKHRP